MTPLFPSIHGDDRSMLLLGELAHDSAIRTKNQKSPFSADTERTMLPNASSPLEEWPDRNVDPSIPSLHEKLTSSALRGRLLQLEVSPGMEQGTPSETSFSRNSISFRHHGEGPDGPTALQHSQAHFAPDDASTHHHLFEISMDANDAAAHPTFDRHAATQHVASTIPTWEAERPCRPNPNSTHDMALFLASWRIEYERGNVLNPINERVGNIRHERRPHVVSRRHIEDGVDMQGINWRTFGTQVSEVKDIRRRYHQHPHIRQFAGPTRARCPRATEQIFAFQQTNTIATPWIEHYQLRNLVATTSFNDIHYVSRSKIMSFGPSMAQPMCVMDLDVTSTPNMLIADFHITALAAARTTLIAGGFRGQYAIQELLSEVGTPSTIGYVSHQANAITNHIHGTCSRSSGQSLAVFCSNDRHLRTLDIATNKVISDVAYDDTMNCAATSPNGRLRVLAGDFDGAFISDADSGRAVEHIRGGSRGHGFACAWADDDVTIATAGQDCQALVWDARNWSAPLATIATESVYPTSLRFSPLGGGTPVLIIAEAADAVSIVNARTYATKQTIQFFGDVAGTAISADGSQLTIANADRNLGGIMTFSRNNFDWTEDSGHSVLSPQQRSDWLPDRELELHPRGRTDAKARRRRGLGLDDMLF